MKSTIKKLLREGLIENHNSNNLTNTDKKVIDFVIGDELNEADGSGILDRFSKLLKSSKKGLLTAAVLTSLMANTAFSSAIQSAPNDVKQELTQIMKDTSGGGGGKIKANPDSKFTRNLSDNFSSGSYELQGNYESVLKELKTFMDNNGTSNYKVKVTASESQVPNQAPFKKRGSLALKRGETLQSIIKSVLGDEIEVDMDVKIGDEPWDGEDKDAEKYSKDQFVKIEVFAQGESFCDIDVDKDGEQAEASKGFISHQQPVNGTGSLNANPGSIPDRFQVVSSDGQTLMDTGYFASANHKYGEWTYVPQYIAELTQNLVNYPDLPAMQGKAVEKQTHTFNSFEELVSAMLKDKSHDALKDRRGEVKSGIKKLKSLWDSGQKSFVFYNIGDTDLKIDTKGQDANLSVYSPVGRTGFSLDGACD
tara:strand:+ start:1871 stop:3136 length:1266 start_codon:yes stop_codon:yes gene_type:complete